MTSRSTRTRGRTHDVTKDSSFNLRRYAAISYPGNWKDPDGDEALRFGIEHDEAREQQVASGFSEGPKKRNGVRAESPDAVACSEILRYRTTDTLLVTARPFCTSLTA